jgi:two-component sensor histidine kinase
LHEEERTFELPSQLFEVLPLAVYVCDQDGLVVRYNSRAAELWGRSPTDISGSEVVLEPQSAQAIATVLYELTTNAVKYGALSIPKGRLRVEWSNGESDLIIRWSETNGPPVKPPLHQGFGTRVVNKVIRAELKGEARFDWHPDGLMCEIAIPVAKPLGTVRT